MCVFVPRPMQLHLKPAVKRGYNNLMILKKKRTFGRRKRWTMQHKLNPEHGNPCDVLVHFLYNEHLSSSSIKCRSLPGLGSPRPQQEAPGTVWRMAAGSRTVALNLTRMTTLSRTRRIQVAGEDSSHVSPKLTKKPSNWIHILVWKYCFCIAFRSRLDSKLQGLQRDCSIPDPTRVGQLSWK